MATTNIQYPFPNENVPRTTKRSKEWLLSYARAAWGAYGNTPENSVGWRSVDRYEKIKKYANGRQDTSIYKRFLSVDGDPENNQMMVEWDILQIIPKYRRIALGNLEKTDFRLRIDPIDPLAQEELEDRLLRLRAKVLTKEFARMMGIDTNVAALMPDSPDEPDDLDGLEAAEMGMRHRTAMEAEQVVELLLNANDWENIKMQIREDLFDYGFGAIKDYQNGDTVGIRRCDPRRMVVSYCHYPDFRDLKYVGEIQMTQAYKIVLESQGEVTRDDIDRIYKMGSLRNGVNVPQPYSYGSPEDFYNSGQIAVLDLEIYTEDIVEKEQKRDKNGNIRFWDKKGEKRNGYEYYQKRIENVYRCKWVVGTDIIYDYGQQYYIKRDPSNRSCVHRTFHMFGSSLHNMAAYSRTESLIPYADRIQRAAYKLEHALNVAVPKGWAIDLTKLEDINMNAGGKMMSKQEVLDMFFNRGVLIYRSMNIAGSNVDKSKPIEATEGGVGNEIMEFWSVIQNNIELMRTTLGLNELTDGSTPNPKLLTTVANLAATGTNNALSDLFYAERYLTKEVAKSALIRAQQIIRYGNPEVFRKSLGQGTVMVIKAIPDIKDYIYSVKIEDMPTEQDEMAFNEAVKVALQADQITVSDLMQLNNISNLKQKEHFLAYKVKKNIERRKQEALELQQQNGQIQVQSAQAAEQAKQQTYQMEYDLKLRNDMEVKKLEMQIEEMKGNFMIEGKRIDATGRVESSFVQAKGRDQVNIRDNKTKLINEGKEAEVEKINIPADLQSRVEPATTSDNPQLEIPEFDLVGGME